MQKYPMFSRLFWSIYFVLGIGLIGFLMGYIVTFFFFCLSFLASKIAPRISQFFLHTAEYIQCFSIRFLLTIQPWLKCKNNFQAIYGFYNTYGTRKVMFVANHRSNLDTFLLISLIPGLRGLAKSSLYYNIFFAPFMYVAGFVPIEKGNVTGFLNGLKLLQTRILNNNRAALVFPETTRCKKNMPGVGKFSAAVFDVAQKSEALIVPICIKNSDLTMGRGDFLLHPFNLIELKIFRAIDAKVFSSAQELSAHVHLMLERELNVTSAEMETVCS